ncbi:hypothetical protein [Mycoplasmopsis bovis]|uniref:hypothetical protein n=1 Tax=Mycoplasmopsis bovis TaxID=28903 RepID=UPI001CF13D10|nr:hypothetical protein [Mycoplasmopsis bovis]UCP05850.1 hypothetical protein JNG56_04300 [Mycoplasmopsis bovis]
MDDEQGTKVQGTEANSGEKNQDSGAESDKKVKNQELNQTKNNSIKRLLSVIQFFLYQQKYSKPILCLLLFLI